MQTSRNPAVDMIRAVALIGISVVNVPFMALPVEAMLVQPDAWLDQIAVVLVELLFQAKFFLLFSFIFGWGMEIQTLSAKRAGASFAQRFSRRLAMLALLGILHALLVFVGDILFLYAVLGLVAWAAKGLGVRGLVTLAALLVPVAMLCLFVIAVAVADMPLPPAEPNLGGSYVETVLTRWRDWPQTFVFLLLFQGHLALAAMLLGMAAARTGFLEPGNAAAARLGRAVPVLLVVGLGLNLLYVAGSLFGTSSPLVGLVGLCSLAVGGPVLSAAYLGIVLRASRRVLLPGFVVLAGRNSLSCYVLQGVLAGLIFGGYGLGLFGKIGKMTLLPLSIGIAVASMAIVAGLARRFGQAPLELVLRRVTYG